MYLKLFVIAYENHLFLSNHLESTPQMTAVHPLYHKNYWLDWLNVTVLSNRTFFKHGLSNTISLEMMVSGHGPGSVCK